MTDITGVVKAAIILIFTFVFTFLIPYLKSKIDKNKQNQIFKWAQIAVKAAEMIYQGVGRGDEKKAYVTEFLASKGFCIDFESIDNLIEAAVFDLKKEVLGNESE